MKKHILLFVIFLLVISLSACGAASNETQSGSSPIGGPSDGTLPEVTQIVIGTFKLEGTEQAVTAEQAADLLPLWQVYQSLSTSDAAAQEEIDALIAQIQETMTDGQMQAIADMELDQEDVFALMQEQGISMGGQGGQNITPEQIATAQASQGAGGGGGFAPSDGGGPPGGFPGGGGGGDFPGGGQGGQSLNPDQIATAQAARGTRGGGFNRVAPPLLNALIQFLEEKAGS